MGNMLLASRFLFRFSVDCRHHSPLWSPAGSGLAERHRLPDLSTLDDRRAYAEVRAGWSREGLAFWVRVAGKRQASWCRESRPDESDGLRIWIDTRDTHNIHRAGRYCHQFIFMPGGSGRGLDEPCSEVLLINRARELPRPIKPGVLKVRREKRIDGYVLEALIPAEALTGFDTDEHMRLGFTYAVVDRELGEQSFNCPAEFPYREDPSLWATLELVA